jgi:hypothetical protein
LKTGVVLNLAAEGYVRRRDFVKVIVGSAVTWPLAASAQQKPVIGFLNSGSADAYSDRITAFNQGLRQLGYVDGENVVIVYRWALGPVRPAGWICGGACGEARLCVGCNGRGAGSSGGQIGDLDDTDRLCNRRRPNQARLGRQL